MRLIPPHKLEVRVTANAGFGVFANTFIMEGEVLEECRLIKLPITQNGPDILSDYRFNYPAGSVPWESLVIATGMGSLFNHSNNFNVKWIDHPTIPLVFRYVATRNILRNEQCYVYYGNDEFP
jgi:hypothetical protein